MKHATPFSKVLWIVGTLTAIGCSSGKGSKQQDEDNDAVTPATGTWTLTDEDGTVINGREDVAISGLSTSNDVVLSGDDLAVSTGFTGVSEKRIFTFEGSYDSDLGAGLPLRDQLIFPVYNLGAIT